MILHKSSFQVSGVDHSINGTCIITLVNEVKVQSGMLMKMNDSINRKE